MPGDLRIRYCSRIPDDSWAESPCNRVGKSMMARPLIPGKQRWVHTEKACTGSGGRPAQGSQLEGATITSSFTGGKKNATSTTRSQIITRVETDKLKTINTAQGRNAILRMGWHLTKGSPVKRGGQLQIGLWFTTSQRAPTPHVPGQGFLHLWLLHASF